MPEPGETRWYHLAGPVGVLRTFGHEVQVVVAGRSAIFWTWDTCLWRSP